MAMFGEDARAVRNPGRVGWLAPSDNTVLMLLAVAHTLAYWSLFVVLHLRSVGWAPGQVLDPFQGYWQWFYHTIFSEAQVMASRDSQEARWHPWMLLASLAFIGTTYLLLLYRFRSGHAANPPRLRLLISLALMASIPLLLLPNLLSGDIYSYIAYGRIAALHSGNPFIEPPVAFSYDPFHHLVYWRHVVSVYGPGWIYPSMVLTWIVEAIASHAIAYILAYKILAFVLHLCNGILIWSILQRWRPEDSVWGTALYLLNPLALIEFTGNAHNDVLMVTGILAAIWFHQRGYWYWSVVVLAWAVLTKWVALPLLLLYGLVLLRETPAWRQRIRRVGWALVLVASLGIGLYWPFWEGAQTLRILIDMPAQKHLNNSLGEVGSSEIQHWMWRLGRWPNPVFVKMIIIPASLSVRGFAAEEEFIDKTEYIIWKQQQEQLAQQQSWLRKLRAAAIANQEWTDQQIRRATLAMVGLTCLMGAAFTRSLRSGLLAGAWIFFVYCAIGAVWFWPWYVTWFVALAALLDWRITGRTAVLFSLLVLLTYVFYPFSPDPSWEQRYRAVIIFVPPLVFVVWHGSRMLGTTWRKRWQRRRNTAPVAQDLVP